MCEYLGHNRTIGVELTLLLCIHTALLWRAGIGSIAVL